MFCSRLLEGDSKIVMQVLESNFYFYIILKLTPTGYGLVTTEQLTCLMQFAQ